LRVWDGTGGDLLETGGERVVDCVGAMVGGGAALATGVMASPGVRPDFSNDGLPAANSCPTCTWDIEIVVVYMLVCIV
jgi:hypothetical protein